MKTINSFLGKDWPVVVIGAGQAGLSTGYYLQKAGLDFVILDSSKQVGDSWRKRWNSLKLFTPAKFNGLPGMPFPLERSKYPTKNDMADYLEAYARNFDLPVLLDVKINRVHKTYMGFELETSVGKVKCDKVVIATGTNPIPRIPYFASELDKNIFQIHSSDYINPEMIPPGDVLVVGAGTSGIEIAIELAASHNTIIAGSVPARIPDVFFRYIGRPYWWFINHVLTLSTPIGRRARKALLMGGGPLIRVSARDLDNAGVERYSRVIGVMNGNPMFDDGHTARVSSIIWSTGYKPNYSWIEPDISDEKGWPLNKRGVSSRVEGLYFIGIPFQFRLTSGLTGGVGKDAKYIINHILSNDSRFPFTHLKPEQPDAAGIQYMTEDWSTLL